MSHDATNWAIKQRKLRPIAKIVLWHLADCHNPTMGCFPTQEYLAERCEISRASVNRTLDELEQAGIIRREKRVSAETKRQLPTRYFLACEADFQPLDVVSRVSSGDTEIAPTRVSKTDEAVSQISAEPCLTAETPKRTSKLTSNGEPVRAREALRLEFDQSVWPEFPMNPNSKRDAAFEAYCALTPQDRVSCIRGVARLSIRFDDDNTDEPLDIRLKYHQHLSTWIKAKGWGQELALA